MYCGRPVWTTVYIGTWAQWILLSVAGYHRGEGVTGFLYVIINVPLVSIDAEYNVFLAGKSITRAIARGLP